MVDTIAKHQGLFSEIMQKKAFILKSAACVAGFWLLIFLMQYFAYSDANSDQVARMNVAYIRSFAFSGAILVALSLAIGPLAVIRPKYNFVKFRRAIGVGGFALSYLHVFFVMQSYFNFSFTLVLSSLNPFANPLIFGLIALPIVFVLFLISTDWATAKLGQKNWKNINRLIYFAFLFLLLHYSLILANPYNAATLNSVPAMLLFLAAISAAILQVYAFYLRIRALKGAPLALWIGIGVVAFYLAMLTLALFLRN